MVISVIPTHLNEEMDGFSELSPTGAQKRMHSPCMGHKEESNKKFAMTLKMSQQE